MRDLLRLSVLPEAGVEALDDDTVELGRSSAKFNKPTALNTSTGLGVKLDWLKDAKAKLETFDVEGLERKIGQ